MGSGPGTLKFPTKSFNSTNQGQFEFDLNDNISDSGPGTLKFPTKSFNPPNQGQFESASNDFITDSGPGTLKFPTKSFNSTNKPSTSKTPDDSTNSNLREKYLKYQPGTSREIDTTDLFSQTRATNQVWITDQADGKAKDKKDQTKQTKEYRIQRLREKVNKLDQPDVETIGT